MTTENIDIDSLIGSAGLRAGFSSILLSTVAFLGLAAALTSFPVTSLSPVAYARGFTYQVWGCFILGSGLGTAVATIFWYRRVIPAGAQSKSPGWKQFIGILFAVAITVAVLSFFRLITTIVIVVLVLILTFIGPLVFLAGIFKTDGGLIGLSLVMLVFWLLAAWVVGYHEDPLTIEQTTLLYNLFVIASAVGFSPFLYIEDSIDDSFDGEIRSQPDSTMEVEDVQTDATTEPTTGSTTSAELSELEGVTERDAEALIEAGFTTIEEIRTADKDVIADALGTVAVSSKCSRIRSAAEAAAEPTDSESTSDSDTSTQSQSTVSTESSETTQADGSDTTESQQEMETGGTDVDTSETPSRSELITALQELDPGRGYPLTTAMRADGPYTPQQYYSEFESWDNALAAADIDKEERLLAEIRRVADIVGHSPNTTEMNEHSVHSSGTYSSHFPSWEAALQEADLPDSATETATADEETSATEQSTDSPTATRRRLVSALEEHAASTAGYPGPDTLSGDADFTPEQYIDVFGSWQAALDAADIDNKSRLKAELTRLADELGHEPSKAEMDEHGQANVSLYADYFVSYEAATEEVFESGEKAEAISGHLGEVKTLASITGNKRLDGPILVKLKRESSSPGDKKEANFYIEDLEGTTAWFNVWSTHELGEAWEVGHWYLLKSARGKTWTSDGQQKQALSSTKDLQVTALGEEKPPADIADETAQTAPTTGAGGAEDESTSTEAGSEDTQADTDLSQTGNNQDKTTTEQQTGSQPEFADLIQLKRDALIVIDGLDEPKGLEIKEELDAYYDQPINHGRLYPNLDALAEAGYVDKFEVTARSNGYRLTETGRELLLARRNWEQAKVANVGGKQPAGTTLESDTTEPDGTNETSKTESDDAISDVSADDEDDDDILDDLMGEFDDL